MVGIFQPRANEYIKGKDSLTGQPEPVTVVNGAISVGAAPSFSGTTAEIATQVSALTSADNGVYTFYNEDTDAYGYFNGSGVGTQVTYETTTGRSKVQVDQQFGYHIVDAEATAEALGTTGAAGDFLHAVIVQANTGTITILDGATTFFVIPAATAVGTRYLINATATTAWKITTPASTSAIGIGNFT
jgi:hypothetical protein